MSQTTVEPSVSDSQDPPPTPSEEPLPATLSYPDCRNDCAIFKKLAAVGIAECTYASIGHRASMGKGNVKRLLMNGVAQKEFEVILETGADAPCIPDDKRRMIDRQINAADHDRRSKAHHDTRAKKELEALSVLRPHVVITPHPDATLEELAPEPTVVDSAVRLFTSGVHTLFAKRWF